jgi:hypothetical protein
MQKTGNPKQKGRALVKDWMTSALAWWLVTSPLLGHIPLITELGRRARSSLQQPEQNTAPIRSDWGCALLSATWTRTGACRG